MATNFDCDKILQAFRHLLPLNVQMSRVQKVIDPLIVFMICLDGPSIENSSLKTHLTLRQLIVMMRKTQIHASRVNVKRFTQDVAESLSWRKRKITLPSQNIQYASQDDPNNSDELQFTHKPHSKATATMAHRPSTSSTTQSPRHIFSPPTSHPTRLHPPPSTSYGQQTMAPTLHSRGAFWMHSRRNRRIHRKHNFRVKREAAGKPISSFRNNFNVFHNFGNIFGDACGNVWRQDIQGFHISMKIHFPMCSQVSKYRRFSDCGSMLNTCRLISTSSPRAKSSIIDRWESNNCSWVQNFK